MKLKVASFIDLDGDWVECLGKAAEDRALQNLAEGAGRKCARQRLGVRLSSAAFTIRLWPTNVHSPLTVVSYFTPSGTGTDTGTVVSRLPAVRREESTAMKAVNEDIRP
jgi:hypothetical protein